MGQAILPAGQEEKKMPILGETLFQRDKRKSEEIKRKSGGQKRQELPTKGRLFRSGISGIEGEETYLSRRPSRGKGYYDTGEI